MGMSTNVVGFKPPDEAWKKSFASTTRGEVGSGVAQHAKAGCGSVGLGIGAAWRGGVWSALVGRGFFKTGEKL